MRVTAVAWVIMVAACGTTDALEGQAIRGYAHWHGIHVEGRGGDPVDESTSSVEGTTRVSCVVHDDGTASLVVGVEGAPELTIGVYRVAFYDGGVRDSMLTARASEGQVIAGGRVYDASLECDFETAMTQDSLTAFTVWCGGSWPSSATFGAECDLSAAGLPVQE
jgi:hypothetical protein